jgi:beta-lactamase regulating signal transducer with metallopeptidase domain
VRHALWLIVLVKLLTPPLPVWSWTPAASAALRPEATIEESPRPPPAGPPGEHPAEERQSLWSPAEVIVAVPETAPPPDVGLAREESVSASADKPLPKAPRPWREGLSAVLVDAWVAGAAIAALLQLLRIARFQRRLARGRAAPAALEAVVADVARRLGVQPPPIAVVPGLASPVVWGLGRARLVWPAALLGQLTADGERAAVVHELAHLRRHDHWVGWLELVAGCVWWWSPLFWHVRRQIGCAAELACDAWVIETLPGSRRAYAEALLAVCELVSRRAAPAPALGMGGARQEMEQAPPGPNLSGNTPAASQPLSVALQTATPPAVDERELRLQKLESNLEALLKEVKDLRAAAGHKAVTQPPKPAATSEEHLRRTESIPMILKPDNETGNKYYSHLHASGFVPASVNQPISLTRTTYTLSREKADALAALLKDLKAPVLETQVKQDGIVVTTTPEAQRIVGDFVGLLQGRMPSSTPKPMQAK